MKKKIITTLLTLTLCTSSTIPAFAGTLSINFNGIDRMISNTDINNDIVVVNGEILANYLNLNYEYKNFAGTIIISDGKNILEMRLGETKATYNGEEIILPIAPKRLADNTIQLPIVAISEIFGATVSYDKDGNISNIYKETSFASSLDGFGVTENTKVYSYDEALKKAINNNTNLKNTEMSFEELDQSYEDLQDTLETTPNYVIVDPEGNRIDFMYSTIRQMYMSLETLESNISLKDDTLKIIETGVELGLINVLNAQETLNMNYLLTLESIKLQEIALNNTKVKYSLGLASDNDVKTAENTYKQSKSSILTLENAMKDLELSLNSMLGLSLTNDTYVEYDVEVEEKDFNVDKLVTTALEESLTIKQAEVAEKNAKKALTYYVSNESKATKEREYEKTRLALVDAKKSVETKVRTTYSEYLQYIENDKTLKIDKENAINTYNTVTINYNLGYVTEYEVKAAYLNIISCESKILQNELAYKICLFNLEHPELF